MSVHYEASTHLIAGLAPSAVSGALLHFKLFSDFLGNVEREVQRLEHWDSAAQYSSYLAAIRADPTLSAYGPLSARYEGSLQLVDLGLLRMPADFASIVKGT